MSHSRHILIVEDEKDIRETLREILQMEGYRVSTAVHGQDALDILGQNDSDIELVLLDLMMPVMDGWEFLEKKACNTRISSLPVIVISAVADKGRLHGIVSHYFNKPVDLDLLLDQLQKLLN